MWSICVQHERAGLFQVHLAALQKLFTLSSRSQAQTKQLLHLQMINGLRDTPVVTLQSGLTLLQRDTVYCSLDLCDALLVLHDGSCRPSVVVVVVGGVWFGSTGMLNHGFDCRHIGCSVSF